MAIRRVKPSGSAPPPDTLVASYRIESVRQFLRTHNLTPGSDTMAWKHYNDIGEVHFGISSGAREVSRAFLKAVRWKSPEEKLDIGGVPQDLVMALQSEHGGQPALISRFYSNRKVTGSGYLFGYPDEDDTSHTWFDFLSNEELSVDGQSKAPNGKPQSVRRITSPLKGGSDDEGPKTYRFSDVIVSKIWTPHPRWTDEADSPLKAIAVICDELDILTRALKAKITSRLATAGFLLFPASIASQYKAPPKAPDAAANQFSDNDFINYVLTQMTTAIIDPSEVSSSVPFVFVVPDQATELVRWIRVESETFEVEIKQRAELIGRVIAGLDLRPEQSEGFSDSNHWSAWSSQDVHLKVDIAPEMEALCWALTKDYLWPQLRAAAEANELDGRVNWDEDEIRRHWVWYDLRELTVRPNQAETFGAGRDRLEISGKAYRKAIGATADDKPTDEEYVRQIGAKTGNAFLATQGLPIQAEIDWDRVIEVAGKSNGPDADSPAEESPSGPEKKQPGGPGDDNSDKPKSQKPQ